MCGITGWANLDPRTPPPDGAEELLHSMCERMVHRGDVTLLVNNAGIGTGTSVLSDNALEAARREFETNVFGPLALSRAFAPALAAACSKAR